MSEEFHQKVYFRCSAQEFVSEEVHLEAYLRYSARENGEYVVENFPEHSEILLYQSQAIIGVFRLLLIRLSQEG